MLFLIFIRDTTSISLLIAHKRFPILTITDSHHTYTDFNLNYTQLYGTIVESTC